MVSTSTEAGVATQQTDSSHSWILEKSGNVWLSRLAEEYERVLNENRDLSQRLSQSLGERAEMEKLYASSTTELVAERDRLKTEITELQARPNGRLNSLGPAREKLMRDEFERRLQELTLQVKRERHKYTELLEKVKRQLSKCICQGTAGLF
jgi:hypothetical protein